MKELSIEQKELLLKDLCARVPYHPKGHIVNACNGSICDEWLTCATFTMFTNITNNCRLYLRPMSSMTKEERKIYAKLLFADLGGVYEDYYKALDYLYANHFDVRGLIPKGLALEAPENMYNVK